MMLGTPDSTPANQGFQAGVVCVGRTSPRLAIPEITAATIITHDAQADGGLTLDISAHTSATRGHSAANVATNAALDQTTRAVDVNRGNVIG